MKFHIVQMNETIEKILFLYNLSKDELVEENRHIKRWDKLIPGTKLKIPIITSVVDSEVMEMEPFIEDYYPKLKHDEGDFSNKIFENDSNNEEKIANQYLENEQKNNENDYEKTENVSIDEKKENEGDDTNSDKNIVTEEEKEANLKKEENVVLEKETITTLKSDEEERTSKKVESASTSCENNNVKKNHYYYNYGDCFYHSFMQPRLIYPVYYYPVYYPVIKIVRK